MILSLAVVLLLVPPALAQEPRPGQAPAAQQPPSQAQAPASDEHHPDSDYASDVRPAKPVLRPSTAFAMPDLPDSWKGATSYDGRLFSAGLALVPIVDFTAFSQDDDSVSQVGEQESQWDLRTFRIMTSGRLKFAHPVSYFISLEVKGKDHRTGDSDSALGFTDWYLSTQLGKLGELRYGKVKEPFIYEIVGDAANLQQQERVLSPTASPTRNIGLRLSNTAAGGRMSWSVGWFNDWYIEDEKFDESGNQFTGRVTGLPLASDDGANYLHLGLSLRYTGANLGTLRFRARPESNISSYYADTGNLPADHANQMNIETLWGRGPFLLSSDYSHSWVDTDDPRGAHFWGGYVVVSYALTGEHRPYDRKVAYARRLLPKGRWGAWEIVGRYSHVTLDSRGVEGGTFDKGTVGLNWWATRRWRLGVDYGLTDLDRFGVHGITHAVHTRIQWIY